MNRPVFSPRMDLVVQERLWGLWRSGLEMSQVAERLGCDRKTVFNRVREHGGVAPRRRQTRSRLSYADRVHIEVALKQGRSLRAIAADLARAPSTISREVAAHRNTAGSYLAKTAHAQAFVAARRPQARKLDSNALLRARVLADLTGRRKFSPAQIAGRLRREFPDDAEKWVHPETIYRWLYLQARGELKAELKRALRSGRAMRRPHTHGRKTGQGTIPEMVSIHDRPPVDDPDDGTRIPGHWEGDLIIGKANASAMGTLVERATGYVMLLHLPHGRGVEHVTAALVERLAALPEDLRKSLTWDQGKELSQHKIVAQAAGIDVYFADPATPWHRPSSENVNGLLRQYFPKSTDLSLHTAAELLEVEQALNDRPRQRLDFATPHELMTQLMLR